MKTLKINTVFKNNFIEMQENDIILRWEQTKYSKIYLNKEQNSKTWTAVLCINEKNEILLIKNYRYALDKVIWEIPRWWLNNWESYIECWLRELKEETNISNINKVQLLWTINTDSWILDSEVWLLMVKINSIDNNILLDKNEYIDEYQWLNINKINKMILNWEIKDTFLINSLYFYSIF